MGLRRDGNRLRIWSMSPCLEAPRSKTTMRVCPRGSKRHPHRSQMIARTAIRSPAGDERNEKTICLTIRDPLKKNFAALVEFASNLMVNHLGQTVINLVHCSQFKIACSSDAISDSTSGVNESQRPEEDARPTLVTAARQIANAPQFNHTIGHIIEGSENSSHAILNVSLRSRVHAYAIFLMWVLA